MIRRSLFLIFFNLFFLSLFLFYAGNTQAGFNASLVILQKIFPDWQFKSTSANNHWLGNFSLSDISIKTKKTTIHIENISGQHVLNTLFGKQTSGNLNLKKIDIELPMHQIIQIDQLNLQTQLSHHFLTTHAQWQSLRYQIQPNFFINFTKGNGVISGIRRHYQFHLSTDDHTLLADGIIKGKRHRSLNLEFNNLAGQIRHQALQGAGSIQLKDNNLQVNNFLISAGKVLLKFNGTMHENCNFDWDIKLPNSNDLLAGSQGQLYAQGHIAGPRAHPQIVATTEGHNFYYHEIYIKHFIQKLNYNADKNSSLALIVDNLSWHNLKLPTINLMINGTLHNQTMTSQIQLAPYRSILLKATGFSDIKHWQGKINQLDFHDKILGAAQLLKPIELSLVEHHLEIKPFVWKIGPRTLNADLNWNYPKFLNLHLASHALPVDTLTPLFPILKPLKGLIKFDLNFFQTDKISQLNGFLNLSNGYFPLSKLNTSLQKINLNFNAKNKIIDVSGNTYIGNGKLNITGQLNL